MTKQSKNKIRLNLDIEIKVKERMQQLQEKTDASSLTDVVRRSLALYDMVTDVQKDGGKVILKHKSGEIETIHIL